MGWWLSLVVAMLTAVLGCAGTGALATVWVDWFRISSREGASGYFVVFLGLLGLGVGFVVGLVCARVVAGGTAAGFLHALGLALATLAALLALAGGLSWLAADFPPTLDGQELAVAVEARLPADVVLPPAGDPAAGSGWHVTITADSGARRQSLAPLDLAGAETVDGRIHLRAVVPLATTDRGKALGVALGERGTQYFRLPLTGRPTAADLAWSDWRVDATTSSLAPLPADQAVTVRYRVQPWVEPRPTLAVDEVDDGAREGRRGAAFAALRADAPLSEWLFFTHPEHPLGRRQAAAEAIARRPQATAELGAEMRSPDRAAADLALRAVALMDPPPPGLGDAVAAVGREIAADLREVNATPVDADPSYELAAAASLRFAGWNEAARALHGRDGVDLLPVMRELCELAAVRAESVTMSDVARVASYYVARWEGSPGSVIPAS